MMKVYLVYEHYFHSFDIIADESLELLKIFDTEEKAYMFVEEHNQSNDCQYVTYRYEEHEVE